MNNGNDRSGGGYQNNINNDNNSNGFNSNLTFPFQMPAFYASQQPYLPQAFEDMDNFNTNDNQKNNQFGYNNNNNNIPRTNSGSGGGGLNMVKLILFLHPSNLTHPFYHVCYLHIKQYLANRRIF